MLQAVSMTLGGRDVQQVVPILISDQLKVICCQVRLQEQGEEEEMEKREEEKEKKTQRKGDG